MDENEIGKIIVNSAIKIHREVGPGLLESVYETILSHQLEKHGLISSRQVDIPFEYDGLIFENGLRADLVVDNKVIIELKCVEKLTNAHHKQLLIYLCLSGLHLGFLLNFSESLMKSGIHRKVNNLTESTNRQP